MLDWFAILPSNAYVKGKFNIGEAVISANYVEMRIDIDADESVHHVKTDNMEEFGLFLEQLQQHRLFTQNLSNNGQVVLVFQCQSLQVDLIQIPNLFR